MDPGCYRLSAEVYRGLAVSGGAVIDPVRSTTLLRRDSTASRVSFSRASTPIPRRAKSTASRISVSREPTTIPPRRTSTSSAAPVRVVPATGPRRTKSSASKASLRTAQPAGRKEANLQRSLERQHKKGSAPSLREGLVYLSLLVPAYAYAQSFVGGDLSRQAPYGLPAQDFAAAISSPASDCTFPIPGYNTSLTAGTNAATDIKIDGWSLNIGVTANVPLTNSAFDTVNKDLCIDATTLSITPPASLVGHNSSSWRVCAVVFTGGLKGAGDSVKTDGSCAAALSDECIRQLQANSVAGKAGRNGGCRDLDVPANCARHFGGDGVGTGFEITLINNNNTSPTNNNRRTPFFAAGFEPSQKGNKTALAAAQRRVWPVLLAWTHFAETGEVQDSAGWLSCARTTDSKSVVSNDGPPSFRAPRTRMDALEMLVGFWFLYFFFRYWIWCIVPWCDDFMFFLVRHIQYVPGG